MGGNINPPYHVSYIAFFAYIAFSCKKYKNGTASHRVFFTKNIDPFLSRFAYHALPICGYQHYMLDTLHVCVREKKRESQTLDVLK